MAENSIKATFFPHQTLPKVYGEPTFQTLYDTSQRLRDNASAVKTTLGGGGHGLLAVLLSPATYHAITGHVWAEPAHPGNAPDLPERTSQVTARNLLNVYAQNLKNWNLVNDTRNALKQQIMEVFDETYYQPLRDRTTGYANVTPLQMLEYLNATYGEVANEDIIELKRQLTAPYDTATTMYQYFNKLEDIQDLASRSTSPITDNDMITQAYVSIKATGIYDKVINTWDDAIAPYKTWTNFKRDMLTAYVKESKKQKLRHPPAQPQLNQVTEQLVEQMSVISESTQSDKAALANLATANQTLVATNADLATKLDKALAMLATMQKQIGDLKKGGTTEPRPPPRNVQNWVHYCWSHGRTNNPNHTSQSCGKRRSGHIEYATFHHRFGGSNLRCEEATT